MKCDGCGKDISDDDSPNIIIGKEPHQFCSVCVAYASVVEKDGPNWKLRAVL